MTTPFAAFSDAEIAPLAERIDREDATPRELIEKLASRGWLGALIPEAHGGAGMDAAAYGALCEEVARGSIAPACLLTVHGMVSRSIVRWGRAGQKDHWLRKLACGEVLGAFALTEPHAGSDAAALSTSAVKDGAGFLLTGTKKWITFGQLAGLYLVFARLGEAPSAFLVPAGAEGLRVTPIQGMLGARGSMLAELHLDRCRVPQESLLGTPGFGLTLIAGGALDYGRFSIACTAVGIAEACLRETLAYTTTRRAFGQRLRDQPLVRKKVSDMVTRICAARLLVREAARSKDANEVDTVQKTSMAKYFASTVLSEIAADAVQLQGAHGVGPGSAVARAYRDARILEIIEGNTELHQTNLCEAAYQQHDARAR